MRLATPSEPANVRIHQIIAPSGASDGPFGHELDYDITEQGSWCIVVGESQMAGQTYTGNFTLNVSVK